MYVTYSCRKQLQDNQRYNWREISIPWQNRLRELTELKKTGFLQLLSEGDFEAIESLQENIQM